MSRGEKLDYNCNASSKPASITTIKIHLDSTIHTYGSKCITLDIKYFYYGTPMGIYKYGHIILEYILE